MLSHLSTPKGKYPKYVNLRMCSALSRWTSITYRCYVPSYRDYAMYGAKGVTMAPEWFNYQVFAEWYYTQCALLKIDPACNKYSVFKQGNTVYGPDTCILVTHQQSGEITKAKSFVFTDPDRREIRVYNLNKFCRENDLITSSMHHVHTGKYRKHRGWTKEFIETPILGESKG